MNDRVLFTAKLLFTLALIAGLCALAADSYAMEWIGTAQVQASGGLNVRQYPSIDAKAVYLLDDTEVVLIMDWHNGWALVAKNKGAHTVLGCACGDYLK